MLDAHLAHASALRSLCLGLALLGCSAPSTAEPAAPSAPVAIELRPVALENGASTPAPGEQLRFLAGFELVSERAEFGGFSGLECDGDNRLIAISDRGHWLSVRLGLDDSGRLISLSEGHMGPLLETDGRAVAGRGRRDAEELAALPGGGFLVTFEGEHRAVRYAALKETSLTETSAKEASPKDRLLKDSPEKSTARSDSSALGDALGGGAPGAGVPVAHLLATRPRTVATPPGVYEGDDNAGFEAVTRLADGRLLLLTEGLKDADGRQMGWLSDAAISDDAAPTYRPLRLHAVELFQPTAAATLPADSHLAGDVLLLQRHYTPITGTRVRLFRLPVAELQPDAVVQPQELMRLEAPRSVDNFEGLAVCRRPQGEAAIYIISDDNFSARQRTLLFQLELMPPGE